MIPKLSFCFPTVSYQPNKTNIYPRRNIASKDDKLKKIQITLEMGWERRSGSLDLELTQIPIWKPYILAYQIFQIHWKIGPNRVIWIWTPQISSPKRALINWEKGPTIRRIPKNECAGCGEEALW